MNKFILRRFIKDECGASTVEYGLIAWFVGGAIIESATMIGTQFDATLDIASDAMAYSLAGQEAEQNILSSYNATSAQPDGRIRANGWGSAGSGPNFAAFNSILDHFSANGLRSPTNAEITSLIRAIRAEANIPRGHSPNIGYQPSATDAHLSSNAAYQTVRSQTDAAIGRLDLSAYELG